jgi:hypothetical protein
MLICQLFQILHGDIDNSHIKKQDQDTFVVGLPSHSLKMQQHINKELATEYMISLLIQIMMK